MIPALIMSPDAAYSGDLENELAAIGGVAVVRRLQSYPAEHEFVRVIRAHGPQLFFVDVASLDEALAAIAVIQAIAPDTHVIACGRQPDQAVLIALMRAGVREYVVLPGGAAELAGAVRRCAEALDRKPPATSATDRVFAFLPSKPGVGCSTVALNSAVAVAEKPGTRALLMDFDLNCGMIGFLMHARTDVSIVEAAEHAAELDEELWPRLVESRGALDIMPSGAMRPGFRIEPAQIRYLLGFARRNYDAICADLSGFMERYSVELMQESKRIYLVCTPELPSIYLARQKLDFLRTLELEDRVRVLLNRAQKHSPVGPEEIEKVIGLPVAASFPNDYRGVHRALTEGKPVERNSELGKRFAALARGMMGSEAEPARVRRFVDYFTLNPARFTLEGDGHSRGAA